ncbi:MAG: hypothetical protein LC734_02055 [Acidobacteria bacterium]|nr:hypothetical protein [Acidobacteriota bacterium]
MNVTVEVEGINDLVSRFEVIRKGTADLRQLGTWDWVQREFYKIEVEMFDTAGSAGKSGQWKPLTPKYHVAKMRKYRGPTRLLIASGKFRKSMTQAGGDAIVEKHPQEMTLGSKVSYAGYLQKGTAKMPARPVIDFSPDHEKRLMEPIKTKLLQLLQNARYLLAHFAATQAEALVWAGGTGLKTFQSIADSLADKETPIFPALQFSDDNDAVDYTGDGLLEGVYSVTFEMMIQSAVAATAVTQARTYSKAISSMIRNCLDATLLVNTGADHAILQTLEMGFDPMKTNAQQNSFLQVFQARATYMVQGKAFN